MNQIGYLESGVIRGVLVALGSLIGLLATKLGFTFDDAFYAQLIDAVLMLLAAGGAAYAGWMRARKANPPITSQAVLATKEREVQEHLEREGGFARLETLSAVAALALLTACSVFGLPQAKSFSDRLAVGYNTVIAVRETNTALVSSSLISADDAQNVQDQADTARAGLDIASSLRDVDQTAADARLRASLQILSALEAYLRSRQ